MPIRTLILLLTAIAAACGNAAATDGDGGAADVDTDWCDLPPSWSLAPTPDAFQDHCEQQVAAECARAFDDCTDLWLYQDEYGSLESCLAEAPGDVCASGPASWQYSYLDEAVAAACLAAIPDAACDEFGGEGGLEECWFLEVPVPPDPGECVQVGPGSITASTDQEASAAWGEAAAVLCLCLRAGVVLDVLVWDVMFDNVVTVLLGPDGEEIDRAWSMLETTIEQDGAYTLIVHDDHGFADDIEFDLDIEIN
jgi:hypothetical protein